MAFKKRRIVDDALREFVAALECVGCGKKPSEPAHIKSKGAGGDDVFENLLPLCADCHRMGPNAQHRVGWATFLASRPTARFALWERGWKLVGVKLMRRYRMRGLDEN